ncbi:Alpha-ketoglutarate-dependent taurine dioxygenase [Emericellopsis cladophorae]|uniref:Alpha-ketoglutarate-dependent taurine dioxygenase n=1 Tax=Emericellopsis cladophorae TaxID=2686198 RepID=A0A9P9Y8R0_9HYPO|nr:Alpha-ketoglutarate-dependent taurine dioxygenase [Emericellopsis cladophorae]KAI6784859.1 Alpha-ketoglutarate-dependent taurine dioxygenase [Emericellopsis cladophorae]
MAPSATEINLPSDIRSVHGTKGPRKCLATLGHAGSAVPTDESLPEVLADHRGPLELSGAPDGFKHFESTPVIGLTEAISHRRVVFFHKQDEITNDLQKELVGHLGKLAGTSASSGLHSHPVMNASREDNRDDAISVISSV